MGELVRWNFLSFWLVLLVLPRPVWAQAPDLFFQSLPGGSELSSQYITAMDQDQFGYIWIGTLDGVNRYDGNEIRTYRSFNRYHEDGLVGSMVEHLVVDGSNQVWVATPLGLSRYNWQHDYFEIVVVDQNLRGLQSEYISSVAISPRGRLLVGVDNKIFIYNGETQLFEYRLTSPLGTLSSILVDKDSALWLGHNDGQGILCYPDPYDTTRYQYYDKGLIGGNPSNAVLAMEEADGFLWAALEGSGLARIHPESGEVKRFYESGGERNFFDLFKDRRDRLWTCDHSGLKLYDAAAEQFTGYYHYPLEQGALPSGLKGGFIDRQGNLYSFHNGQGVHVSANRRGFHRYTASDRTYWHTTGANISAVQEDHKGNLWLGNYNGGIDVFNWQEGRPIRFRPSDEVENSSLGQGSVLALFCDSQGQMWAGIHGAGLHRFNEENGAFDVWRKGLTVNAPSHNDVRSIIADKEGGLWLGLHGGGIDYFNGETFVNYNAATHGLSSDWVYSVLLDQEGNIWVGTTHGLNVLRTGEEQFEVFLSDSDDPYSLAGNQVLSLLEDRKGQLWVGTNNGLYAHEGEGRFTRFAVEMSSQFFAALEEDNEGKLWVATLNSLGWLNPESGHLLTFDEMDGLQAPGFNLNASFSNISGRLFFAGPQGVNHFLSSEIEYNTEPPFLRFSRLRIFNEAVDTYGEDQLLDAEINQLDEVVLDYDQKFFSLEFVALNLLNPSRNHYACKLEGFDKNWVDLGNRGYASYTNLYPGTYVFRVKAANNDGVWNEEGISIRIVVNPPWWMTWWFLSALFAAMLVLIWAVFRYRTRQLQRQKIELESKVAGQTVRLRQQNSSLKRRADELEEANRLLEERRELIGEQASKLEEQAEELRASNEQLVRHLQTKDRLYSLVAHDLRAPFNTIMGFASLLTDAGDDADKEKVKMYARFINDAALQVFNLLENLLFWARSQSDEIQFSPSALNLSDLIRETLDLLSDSALKKTVAMYEQVDTDVQVYADENMLRTIVRNLLMNALKFTDAGGEVRVAAKKSGEQIRICVIDSGVGMDAATLEKISSAQGHTESGTRGEKGSGLGLLLCRDFIERNGGQLEVSSTPGKGSRFCFTLPLAD